MLTMDLSKIRKGLMKDHEMKGIEDRCNKQRKSHGYLF